MTPPDLMTPPSISKSTTAIFGIILHDLMNSISVTKTNLQFLQDNLDAGLDERNQRMVDIALWGSNELSCMLNDLSNLAKAKAGLLELPKQSVSISEMFQRIEAKTQQRLELEKKILHLKIPESDVVLFCSVALFERCLEILVASAIYLSRDSHICLVAEAPIDGELPIKISYKGMQIPTVLENQIFTEEGHITAYEMGYRIDKALGLVLVGSVMTAHNGKVQIKSAGDGGFFSVTLPIKNASSA